MTTNRESKASTGRGLKNLQTIPHENLHCTKCGVRHDWIQRPPTMCAKCWGEWLAVAQEAKEKGRVRALLDIEGEGV